MDYSDRGNQSTGIKGGLSGVTTEYATAAIVIGCLVGLIVIRRGFRGLRVPGVGGVNLG
jgi:hypothetical protein